MPHFFYASPLWFDSSDYVGIWIQREKHDGGKGRREILFPSKRHKKPVKYTLNDDLGTRKDIDI